VLQCVVQCVLQSVLRCVVVRCSMFQCFVVCCSVLQCVAVCCSVLQCVAVSHSELASYCHLEQTSVFTFKRDLESSKRDLPFLEKDLYGVLLCAMLCVAVCCSVLQCVAVWFGATTFLCSNLTKPLGNSDVP